MRTRGKIQNISRGLDGGFVVTLSLPEAPYNELIMLDTEDLWVELTKYHARRSLDANAYFHVLVGKIASALGRSRTAIKNKLIGDYGQIEIIDGKMVPVTTQLTPEQAEEMELLHLKLLSIKPFNDRIFYNYIVMRGSHTYDTKEMSILIDGTVAEAKDLGIETLTPEEIERIKRQWRVRL